MNTESVACRKVEEITQVGDFKIQVNGAGTPTEETHIYIWIPGMSGPDAIRITRGPSANPRIWGWDGDEELPTLTPSIHATGEWHGYLTDGKLISC